jgi:hypothetical protein
MHIFLNIYKILITFPNHTPVNVTKENIKAIKTKMIGNSIAKKEISYLDGDFDDERLSDYTSNDEIKVYISSIDSYYYLAKKYNIWEKNLFQIFEIYDYIERISEIPKYPKNVQNYMKELLNILARMCQTSYNIDIKNLFTTT